MEFGDSKGHLSEERVPCPWDTTRDPEDLSREMSERVKEDVVDHHASKIDRVLQFNYRVSNREEKGSE